MTNSTENREKLITEKLENLLNNVTQHCRNLFSESQRYRKIFEKGIYACVILSPSKRMRTNMGIDREVLLVASTFQDQQPRTLRFIVQEIENSSGRLESTVVMVVHLDRGGNLKLRNWGREAGISVIAINGNTEITSERDFERRLSEHLYSHDPFDVSGPVSSDTSFFGRREEAIDLARKLQNGQIRSCLGIRKIGKTSIINRVLLEIRRTYDCICIMIDCSRDEIFDSSAEKLIFSIAESIKLAKLDNENYRRIYIQNSNIDLVEARERVQTEIMSSNKPIIVVFDEVDYLTPSSPTAKNWMKDFNRFWRALRTIYQECLRENKVFSILVGGVSSYWFTVDEVDGVENSALAFVPEEFLSPIPTGASVAMLGPTWKNIRS